MPRIVSIQYLRAVAAIFVVIYHYVNAVNERLGRSVFSFDFGAFGVDIFFVISGFIMYSISTTRVQTPLGFMRDRVMRIVPLYWVLTFFAAFISLDGGISLGLEVELRTLLTSLFFIPDWNEKYPLMVAPVVILGWTLNLEMMFYALFAISLFFARGLGLLLVLSAIAFLGTLRLWIEPPGNPILDLYSRSVILEFGLGLLVGVAFQDARITSWIATRRAQSSGVAAGLMIFGGIWLALLSDLWDARVLSWGVPATCFVVAALLIEPALAAARLRLLEFLGDASYSIYLTHIMAMPICFAVIGVQLVPGIPAISLMANICAAIAIGCMVYICVERPLIVLMKRLRQT